MDYIKQSEEERRILCNLARMKIPLIDINNYQKICEIGKGSFSTVYKIKEKNTSKIYTAKSFSLYNNDFSKFYRQINILSQLSNPNIAKCIGYSLIDFNHQKNPIIISEYYPNRSLKNIIEQERGINAISWTDETKIKILIGIARAISYLHSNHIIHRDLKPDNILLDQDYIPYVCDFECAKTFTQTLNEENDSYFGAPLYMSPENLKGFAYTEKSDVYAFGLIVYEMLVGPNPFENLEISQIFYKVAIKKEKPKFNDQIPHIYKEIIESCLDYDPDKRPTLDEIIAKLAICNEYIHQISDMHKPRIIFVGSTGMGKSSFGLAYLNLTESEIQIKMYAQDLKIQEIDLKKFKKLGRIGYGGYGNVYLIQNKFSKQKYAAKQLLVNKSKIKDFLHELEINSEVHNPLVTKLIGYSLHGFEGEPSMIIITEYISNGSLERILHQERNNIKTEAWNETMKLINIYRIASAISYLHSRGILHLDIKPSNILVDEFILAKICDFSISIKMENDQIMKKEALGTCPFISPEIFKNEEPTTKSDVYSFGMLLYEMISKSYPYEGLNACNIIYNVTISGKRPKLNKSIPEIYQKLIKSCWDDDPNKRPTFETILNELRNNKEFITKGVDESLYRTYINIIDNEMMMVDSTPLVNKLFRRYNLNDIYGDSQYEPSEYSTSDTSYNTTESIEELKDETKKKNNSYSFSYISKEYFIREGIMKQTSKINKLCKINHRTISCIAEI